MPVVLQAQVKNIQKRPDTTQLYMPHQLIVKFKSATTTKGYRTDDASFLTKYEAFKQLGVRKNQKLHPHSNIVKQSGKSSNSRTLVKNTDLSLIYQIEFTSKLELNKAIQLLKNQPDVIYAEPVYRHFPLDVYMPNDPQAHSTGQYYLSEIKAFESWALEKGNPSVTIGVVDYGFIPIHEDLAGNIQYNLADPVDGKDNDIDGYIDNYAGWNVGNNNTDLYPATPNGVHGTWTGGIAAAVADNGKGIAGTGFNCKFLPVKAEGIGWNGKNNFSYFNGYAGLLYAAQHGSKVINLSWGRPGVYSAYEENIINYVVNVLDVVIVAAAGNDNNEVLYWPASYDKIISVAGTDYEDRDRRWQSYDPAIGSNYNEKVDICAPSEYIKTTSYSNPPDNNSGYTYFYDARSGTSMAAPQVSAAAALVRSKYPTLTAAEVKNRLLATADNIDALNPGYAGKLGRGRLNIHKALSDVASIQAVSLEQYKITNQQGQPFILSGDKATIALYLKSMFGTFNNLQARLTSLTDGVTVTKAEVSFDPFSPGQIVDNTTNAFEIQANAALAANTQITFRIDLKEDSFTYTQHFTITANPDYLNIQNNQVSLTVSNKGRFGYDDDFLGWTEKGSGFTYKGNNLLFEGGFLVGKSAAQVSNSIMSKPFQGYYAGNTYLYWEIGKDDHFKAAGHFNSFTSPAKDIEIRGVFTDTLKSKNPNPVGVKVTQRNYTWQNDKFIIVEYQISNVTDTRIDTLFAGISANFDIQGAGNNQAIWDTANKMGYMYNKSTRNLYAGVQLLTNQKAHYYIIDHLSAINLIDDYQFTTAEKYASLSSSIFNEQSTDGAQDVQQTLSAQVNNLKPGETRTVAFAFLAGDNLADLQASAAIAQNKFTQLKTSPAPVLAHMDICKDENATIVPRNGHNFNLYTALPLSSPLATGSEFYLGKVTTDSTYYITSIDSLYESLPVAVQVKAISHTSAFNILQDTIGIYEGDRLQLTDKSTEATKWTWNFGDSTISSSQNPSHQYINPGKYTIKLVSENKIGCRDSLTKEVLVVNGIKSLMPTITDKVLCNGERLVLSPLNGSNFNLHSQLPLTTPINSGITFDLGSMEKDTVFYITCTDFLLESEPVKVNILVSNHSSKFELSDDTLDLRLLQQIKITDKSAGAVKWQWDFGDAQTSTEQNPAHSYDLPGEYLIKLVSDNNAGCQSTYAEKITVIQTTGLEEVTNSFANIFPNPSSGKVKILLAEEFAQPTSEILITNLVGQHVYRSSIQGTQAIIDLSGYVKGHYVIRITSGGKTINKKLILQ